MGISRHFFPDRTFLLSVLHGSVDGESLKTYVLECNRDVGDAANLRELADCRRVTDLKGLSVRAAIACAGAEADRPQSKLAILVPPDSNLMYGVARAYQTFAETRRQGARVFRNFDQAVAWLSDSAAEGLEIRALIAEAPVENMVQG